MARHHVILTDELGDEFSVEISAETREDAWETAKERTGYRNVGNL